MEAIVINSDSEDEKNPNKLATRSNPLPTCRACKGICGSPDNMPLLPPPTSQSPLDALFPRSRLRAPKRPLQTLVELFPVIDDVNREFRAMLGKEYTEANIMRFMQFYIRTMRKLQEQVHKYPNKCRALSRNVCRTLLLIKKMSTNVIEQQTPYYMQKICELLAIYMFLELRYASSYAESKAKAVERIVNNILLHLESPDITYVLRIFAYIPFVGKEAYIVSRVFQRLIPIVVSGTKNEFNDRLYVQYLIAFYHWKDAEALPNSQENVIALANAFMKPKRTLKSNIVYARHLPCYEKRENATRYFLTNLVFFNDLRNASLLDGVAVMVDDTIDLSDEVETLCTDYSELELNKAGEQPKDAVKQEIVSRVTGTVDLTDEDETPWLTSLARTARDREVKLPTAQRKPTPEVIELDSSDEESCTTGNQNPVASEAECTQEETDLVDSIRTSQRTCSNDVFFDSSDDSTSDVLIRAAITGSTTSESARPEEDRLTFDGFMDQDFDSLRLSPSPLIPSLSSSEDACEDLNSTLDASINSTCTSGRSICESGSSIASTSANATTEMNASSVSKTITAKTSNGSGKDVSSAPNLSTKAYSSASSSLSESSLSTTARESDSSSTKNVMQSSMIDTRNVLELESSIEMTEDADSRAKGCAMVADILTSPTHSSTSDARVDESAGELIDTFVIGESTIDESTAAPKEAVTLNLETYTNSFICGEENDEFLRYYDTTPPVKTYLRKTAKKLEAQVQRGEETRKSDRHIDENGILPLSSILASDTEVTEKDTYVQAERRDVAPSPQTTALQDKVAGEQQSEQVSIQNLRPVKGGAQVLFSRRVISLREDDCANGRVTPSYLKVPESVEVSSQGSNVVFSMQGRRLSSFPPLQVSSPNHHTMPDFDADIFSECEETQHNAARKSVASPTLTTLPKTIIKPTDVENEKPATQKRRTVWFSDKNEVREIAPRDELSEFAIQSSLMNISASINTLNATKQQFLPSPSTSQHQQHQQTLSSSTISSHQQQSTINAYKSQSTTAAATTPAINPILLKKSMPPTTATTTSTSHDTASLKSAQEKALLRELFPQLFVAAGKTENEIISEITDTIKASPKNVAAHHQKKLISAPRKPSSSTSSHKKSRSSSSSCMNYRINHIVNESKIENRRKSMTTPTYGKQQTLSEFDRYLLNLQKKRDRANTQTTKDVKRKRSRRKSSNGSRKHVNNIKSLVDITTDVKLNRLRTRVVIERTFEHIFRAALERNEQPVNTSSAESVAETTTTAVPTTTAPETAEMAETTTATVTQNTITSTMTVSSKTVLDTMPLVTTASIDSAPTITTTTANTTVAVAEECTVKATEDDPQPDPMHKVMPTEYVVCPPEKLQPHPIEPMMKVPPTRPDTKSLGDILTDIVEQEVIAQVVKDKVLPMSYPQLGMEKGSSPLTVLPQLAKEPMPPPELPEPFVLSNDVAEKTEPPALGPELNKENPEAPEKGSEENNTSADKSEIPSPQFEAVHVSDCLGEQTEKVPPSSPVDSVSQNVEEKAPEALIDLPQTEPVTNDDEVKPPVEADPSKSELKPIKLEDVESEAAVPEGNTPSGCSKTSTDASSIADVGLLTTGEDANSKAVKENYSPVRLEVAEEVEVQTEPLLDTSDIPLETENAEDTLPDVVSDSVEPTEKEFPKEATEETKEIKITLKRYELLKGEKYMIVSNSGTSERRASTNSDIICPSRRKRPNRIVSDDEEEPAPPKRNDNDRTTKKEVVLKKIFERYRAEEMENDCNHHRRDTSTGVPLGHNIESISTPPPTPPSRSLSPPPATENKSHSTKNGSESGRPRVEHNNNNSRPSVAPAKRCKPSHALSNYLSSNSDMIQEFRKHVNMPTEVAIDSNSLAFFYEYLIKRKDDRAMEEINKIMPLLKAIDSSKAKPSRRRRFDSCHLPSMHRPRKHSSEIYPGSAAKEASFSMVKKRRKTICSDSHYLLSSPDFDEDICSSPKAADSPTAEVMRLHSGNRVGLPKKALSECETITSTVEGDLDVRLNMQQDEFRTTQDHNSRCNAVPASSSPSLASAAPSTPSFSLPISLPHNIVTSVKKSKSGDSHSDQDRSRKHSRRATKSDDNPRNVVKSKNSLKRRHQLSTKAQKQQHQPSPPPSPAPFYQQHSQHHQQQPHHHRLHHLHHHHHHHHHPLHQRHLQHLQQRLQEISRQRTPTPVVVVRREKFEELLFSLTPTPKKTTMTTATTKTSTTKKRSKS